MYANVPVPPGLDCDGYYRHLPVRDLNLAWNGRATDWERFSARTPVALYSHAREHTSTERARRAADDHQPHLALHDGRREAADNDVLVYSTPPLEHDLAVAGFIEVELYVSSDAKDTDSTLKLIDVDPDGVAYNLDDDVFRARYREG